jgi:hypothetical protein
MVRLIGGGDSQGHGRTQFPVGAVMLNRWLLRSALLLLCCTLLTGCVARSDSGTGTSFHYQWWLPVSVFAAGVVCVPIGMALWKKSGRLALGLVVAGPGAALVLAPSLLFENVFVDGRGCKIASGIWGMTANLEIEFDQVKSIRIAHEETGGRQSRLIEVLYFEMKSGQIARFPPNNEVKTEAGKEIVACAARRGIPVAGLAEPDAAPDPGGVK